MFFPSQFNLGEHKKDKLFSFQFLNLFVFLLSHRRQSTCLVPKASHILSRPVQEYNNSSDTLTCAVCQPVFSVWKYLGPTVSSDLPKVTQAERSGLDLNRSFLVPETLTITLYCHSPVNLFSNLCHKTGRFYIWNAHVVSHIYIRGN